MAGPAGQGLCRRALLDAFNPGGQNWQLPAFVPWKLRAAAYEPFVQTIRAAVRHAAGVRIDHVMGLFRLFWIPDGAEPAQGAYVRYPADDLLGIAALESHRGGVGDRRGPGHGRARRPPAPRRGESSPAACSGSSRRSRPRIRR